MLSWLRNEIRSGTPIVGMEPSCLAVFKDELEKLMPHDDDANRLALNSYHFAEFSESFDVELPRTSAAQALLWGHCHQRATGGVDADEQVLEKMGFDVESLSGGCCGSAGSWGLERGKYQLSLDCGEQALLPAIRNDPAALVVANGFSCQTQISDAGAVHLGQVMAMARGSGDIRSGVPPPDRSPTHAVAPPGWASRSPRSGPRRQAPHGGVAVGPTIALTF